MTTIRYTEAGAGARDGRAWSAAKPFSQFGRDLGSADPGDNYLIGFDLKREDPIFLSGPDGYSIARSGAPDRFVRILAGMVAPDGVMSLPALGAGRHFFIVPGGLDASLPARFRLVSASYVSIEDMLVDGGSADGFVKFAGEGVHRGCRIQDLRVSNCGRVIESGREAVVHDLLVEECVARRLGRGFARFRDLRGATFRDCVMDAGGVDEGGSNVIQLIAVQGGQDILVERCSFSNAVNVRPDYTQGDGLVCERGVRGVRVRSCTAQNMGDAGFDLKADEVSLEDCRTAKCKYGVRIWSASRNLVRRCRFLQPVRRGKQGGAAIEAQGTADVVDCTLEAAAGCSVFRLPTPNAVLRVRGGRITIRDNAPLVAGDPAARVELTDVTINGALVSGRRSPPRP